MVVDRSGNLTAYLNGIQAGTPINIAADSGKSLDGILPIRIGQDGTGVYGPKFEGGMDELKIWKRALSEIEIRQNICQKISGADTNLIAYYRMDETSGNILSNLAATGAVFNGTLLNNPQRVISGAAIGDTSMNVYPASWTGTSLSLSSNAQGTLAVDSVASNTQGLHIYRINDVPNFSNGVGQIGNTSYHFGVFTPGNKNADYRMTYNYTAYPDAVANSTQLHIYNRNSNADSTWIQAPANNDAANHILSLQQALGVKQYLLADFSAAACPTPTGITVTNVDTGNATISWLSAAAGHIIEMGDASFSPGTGTQVSTTGASLALNNLSAAQTYKFYIKDSCSAGSSSALGRSLLFYYAEPLPFTGQCCRR